ncbi:peroxisomal membrane protein PMP47A [Gaeumannomyces tritici R3-111a-1]|uniref:Peroxisomal membrane protein PMP47A n=1 Tax=Gaeumannomyces tritici (strain R3-111a-1) TaxID=644352 RepID=J3PCR5_GAET3|nr:peroxisomal membrane protein PMP47A [Gaeumannomyces tritici R3-111a-1]EJT72035.1 peroxisomal membrane protein PMP47A [Gaeumannomyces tritici R3-111a-1]
MVAASKPVIPQNDNVAHALAGAGGGILSMVLTYPLITLSTRAQVESKRAESAFLEAARRIVAREGASGLYAGLSSALFGISVTNFVYYYWYEWTRAFFESAAARAGRSRKLTTVESMLAGALAGSATVLITNPIWVVNTRITTRKQQVTAAAKAPADEEAAVTTAAAPGSAEKPAEGEATAAAETDAPKKDDEGAAREKAVQQKREAVPGTLATLLALLRHEGPQALFRGVVPALVLVINPILQYTLFEQLKNTVERRRRVTPMIAFLLGALGKLFATTITYPYITVKSQMHVADNGAKKEGMSETISRVIREEGYAGLYKGIGPKVSQSVLTAALLFAFKDVLYEQTVRLRGTMAKKALSG